MILEISNLTVDLNDLSNNLNWFQTNLFLLFGKKHIIPSNGRNGVEFYLRDSQLF